MRVCIYCLKGSGTWYQIDSEWVLEHYRGLCGAMADIVETGDMLLSERQTKLYGRQRPIRMTIIPD